MHASELVAITLRADQWNTIIAVLQDARYCVAAPLITAITTQAMAEEAKRSTSPAPFNRAAWAGAESEE